MITTPHAKPQCPHPQTGTAPWETESRNPEVSRNHITLGPWDFRGATAFLEKGRAAMILRAFEVLVEKGRREDAEAGTGWNSQSWTFSSPAL